MLRIHNMFKGLLKTCDVDRPAVLIVNHLAEQICTGGGGRKERLSIAWPLLTQSKAEVAPRTGSRYNPKLPLMRLNKHL